MDDLTCTHPFQLNHIFLFKNFILSLQQTVLTIVNANGCLVFISFEYFFSFGI